MILILMEARDSHADLVEAKLRARGEQIRRAENKQLQLGLAAELGSRSRPRFATVVQRLQ